MFARISDFFQPPERENLVLAQKARFLHVTLLVVAGASLITGLLNSGSRSHLDVFLFAVGALSLIAIPFNRRGYYVPVALLVSLLVLSVITFSLLGVGLKDAGVVAYPLFIILTAYLLNKKAAFFAVVLSIDSALLIYALDRHGFLDYVAYSNENRLAVVTVLLVSTGLLLWVIIDNWERVVQDLKDTYDATLLGWGKALEYRDQETQGHCRRVVELTMLLARKLNIPESKMEHIRRGALLHDIGKMAVPDAILLKQGGLTDAEREIMNMHPVYARNLLESIPYLKPALEIPYCHHERWDGTGYPNGLSGEAIPIAARIFSVVDVWDALTSDRPYHKAWSHSSAQEFIQSQSGKMFDPHVVNEFLQHLQGVNQPLHGV